MWKMFLLRWRSGKIYEYSLVTTYYISKTISLFSIQFCTTYISQDFLTPEQILNVDEIYNVGR